MARTAVINPTREVDFYRGFCSLGDDDKNRMARARVVDEFSFALDSPGTTYRNRAGCDEHGLATQFEVSLTVIVTCQSC